MGYLYTGWRGVSLKEIIKKLGNNNYDFIECRCKWTDNNGQEQDDFFGACSYIDGVLTPLDGDSYYLGDLYIEWEEFIDTENKYTNCGGRCLTVWECGNLSECNTWEEFLGQISVYGNAKGLDQNAENM